MAVDDLGRVLQLDGVRYLNAADQVLEEMPTGWRRQQLSRNLGIDTIDGREWVVRRFLDFTKEMPWRWTHSHVEEYFGDLRSAQHRRHSAVRHPARLQPPGRPAPRGTRHPANEQVRGASG